MQVDKKVERFSLEEYVWRGLTLTDAAARQIRRLVENNPSMLGLRLNVKHSGCAGFVYVLEHASQDAGSDRLYEHKGARLYVALKAMPFIDGTELDYVHEGLNHVFKFNNPKAQFACGCGESFGLRAMNDYGTQ
ncbi:Fe-S cluster assembly scaffold SufA [secondary endosymbiont of Ctenarytaina eucalypti]|uniref:Iron-sulfur cluster assembly accessory protein n=1 Tax=secondary endosymbiont of Ctenarytaina eucalypti TaxID=1199245 RepID=J3VRV0_9ENTR|nr:Fe-S cluster assembly scaffold SufA [secondary endosymbiont of Ctenarytaina eucalypti]AFP84701.1 Iron-sulfur cluster assembly accessory protein [secondary endosymbiont of Ctenarytaina eucalypti]